MATKKITPEVTDTPPVEPTVQSDDIKVEVRSAPLVIKEDGAETTRPDLTVHHELTITPPETIAKSTDVVEVATEPEAVQEEVPPEPEIPEVVRTPEPTETVTPVAPTNDAPKGEPQSTVASEVVPAKPEEMQSPKVFDTKQYHLPIDEGATHGKGKYLTFFAVALLVIVVVLAVAIDAGWIDLGFKLPFDLIK